MPEKFKRLVKQGAKIRTKKLPGGKFVRVAVRPKGAKGPRGGRTVAGEVKKKKKTT